MSMSRSPSPPYQNSTQNSNTIDRQSTTPFLLHFCYRSNAFHNLTDFPVPTPSNPKPPLPSHLQIYTWYSCTLKELAHLLTSALPKILPDPVIGTRLSFRLVYPDTSSSGPSGSSSYGGGHGMKNGRLGGEDGRGRYISKEMGSVVVSAGSHTNGRHTDDSDDVDGGQGGRRASFELGGDDADKSLAEARFVIGDYIDCAVFPPLSDGSVVPRNSISNSSGVGLGLGARAGRGFRENGYGRPRVSGYGSGSTGGGGGMTRGSGAYGSGRGDFGSGGAGHIPSGEWRRGERLPETGHRDSGGTGGAGFGGRPGRRAPY